MECIIEEKELDFWWGSLRVKEKERIATKACSIAAGRDVDTIKYPYCSFWWRRQNVFEKKKIHDHCVDKHGDLIPEYREGKHMSY